MRLRHIEVFQAVMETGSMSAAGRLIHLTQSAVSRLIASAEIQLGYPLFHRAGGRLVPTAEGLALFEESSALFEKLESLKRTAMHLKSGEHGSLRVAAIPAICHKLLPDVLERFRKAHPHVICEIHTLHKRQIANELLSRSVDLGLDYYGISHPGVEARVLGSGTLYAMLPACVSRNGSSKVTTAALLQQRLADMPMIAFVEDDPLSIAITRFCEHHGLRLESRTQVQTSQLAEELVARGMGWTVVDFLTASKAGADVFVTQLQPIIECTLNAFFAKSHSPTLLARRFTEIARSVVAERIRPRRAVRA